MLISCLITAVKDKLSVWDFVVIARKEIQSETKFRIIEYIIHFRNRTLAIVAVVVFFQFNILLHSYDLLWQLK